MRVLLVLAASIALAYGRVTPEDFPKCRRDDPELERCALAGVEALRERLRTGLPELHLPVLDPFLLPKLKLDRSTDNMRIKAVIKNARAVGGHKFNIEKLKIKLGEGTYAADIKMTLPKLAVSGDYDVRGSRAFGLEINGKGHMKSVFTGITVVAKGTATPVQRDGDTFLKLDKLALRTRIADGRIQLDDSERPGAAQSAAAFFNSNPKSILELVNPLVEETGATVARSYINKVLETVPLSELLQD